MRKTCGFAQIAQNKLRKTKISFNAQLSQKNISGYAQIAQKNSAKPRKKIAQNSLRFMHKNSAKDLAISWKPYSGE